jgi:predicted transcriptional regulator
MIVEVGSEDPPQIYVNLDFLVMAWVSLHVLYGVPISEEEREVLTDNRSDEYDRLFSDPL